LAIEQGEGLNGENDLGSNFVFVGTDVPAVDVNTGLPIPGVPAAGAPGSPVYVGYSTAIEELGVNNGNNWIQLGGIGGPDTGNVDFETGYLDVYTGFAGGSYTQVENTKVDFGWLDLFGNVDGNIGDNGPGNGNTYFIDANSSPGGILGGVGVVIASNY
jgi:hypothetical protein